MDTTNAPLLSRKEISAALSVSLRTVDELISRGDLPVVRIGKSVRVRPTALDYLIEARESRTNPKRKGAAK